MRYLSVCSGIEAASKAWEPIGWEPVAFSEIEPFPAAVLKHHWPKVQNLGDMTKYEQWPIQSGTIDLLVGGTPCQSFSVAGLRQGLKDPRGNLMLTYLAIAERLKPRWLVWENVPGVLSSNGGKDFGSFLGALGELGYEWAYRVLDAQWFGVAQRRRRVFVVAHLGKGNVAAKVLFESESVRRNPAPSRETRQGVATAIEAGVGSGKWPADIASTLNAAFGSKQGLEDQHALGGASLFVPEICGAIDCRIPAQRAQNAQSGHYISQTIPIHDQATRHSGKHGDKQDGKGNGLGVGKPGDPCPTLTKGDKHAIAFPATMSGTQYAKTKNLSPAICSVNQTAVAVDAYNQALQEKAAPIRSAGSDVCHTGRVINPADRMAVRRLTPRECERLQGFNDDHTMIPWRNKPADQCPDGPRYKALGNSMAVPCMAWIGERIEWIENERQGAA